MGRTAILSPRDSQRTWLVEGHQHAFRGTVRATTADGRVPVLPGLLAGQQGAAAARRSPSLPARAVLDGDSDRGVHVESLPAQDAEISFCGLAHVAQVRGGVLRFYVILSVVARHREFRDWMPMFDDFGSSCWFEKLLGIFHILIFLKMFCLFFSFFFAEFFLLIFFCFLFFDFFLF